MPSLSLASTLTTTCSPGENVAPVEGMPKLAFGEDEEEDDEDEDDDEDELPPVPTTSTSVILSQELELLPKPTILTKRPVRSVTL